MSAGYKIFNQSGIHFLTFQVVYWIDIFTRQIYRDIFIDSLRFCQKEKGLRIHAYVIMSNHIHCILSTEKTDLSTLVKEFKTFTSKAIIKAVKDENESRRDWMLFMFERAAKKHSRNSQYQFWTHENHAKEIVTFPFMEQKLDYIHNNPVRAGIVNSSTDYIYSSARNYGGMVSMLKIDYLK